MLLRNLNKFHSFLVLGNLFHENVFLWMMKHGLVKDIQSAFFSIGDLILQSKTENICEIEIFYKTDQQFPRCRRLEK